MKTNYTIDEILVAVDKIQNIKRERHRNINQRK